MLIKTACIGVRDSIRPVLLRAATVINLRPSKPKMQACLASRNIAHHGELGVTKSGSGMPGHTGAWRQLGDIHRHTNDHVMVLPTAMGEREGHQAALATVHLCLE